MFYSRRECLMHNYCLSKQIYTVAFLLGLWCGWLALSVFGWQSAASCHSVMCCYAGWTTAWLTEQQMDWAQWLVMEVATLKTLGFFVFSSCCYFGLWQRSVFWFLLYLSYRKHIWNHKTIFTQTLSNTTQTKTLFYTEQYKYSCYYYAIKLDFCQQRRGVCNIATSSATEQHILNTGITWRQ